MHRSTETELQLRSAANAADRRNRPAILVFGPAALLVIAILYALWAMSGYAASGRAYRTASADIRGIFESIQDLLDATRQTSQTEDRYEVNSFLLTDTGDTETSDGQGIARRVGLQVQRVDNKGISNTQRNEPVGERTVHVLIEGQELETIFAWLDACLHDPRYKGRLYVDSVNNLRPNRSKGWDVTIILAIYEKNSK